LSVPSSTARTCRRVQSAKPAQSKQRRFLIRNTVQEKERPKEQKNSPCRERKDPKSGKGGGGVSGVMRGVGSASAPFRAETRGEKGKWKKRRDREMEFFLRGKRGRPRRTVMFEPGRGGGALVRTWTGRKKWIFSLRGQVAARAEKSKRKKKGSASRR